MRCLANMGEMADWANEQGFDELVAHQVGDCDFGCPYCEQEAAKKAKQVQRRRGVKGRRARANQERHRAHGRHQAKIHREKGKQP